jgi:anti-sigma B factor antagonist
MQGGTMEPVAEKVGDVTIVAVNADHLDSNNADEFRRDLAPVLQDCRKLVLDLDQVQSIDSRGCGVVISCLKHLSSVGGDLKLCGVGETVRMVFDLIHMERVCEILGTRDEALKAFKKKRKR